MIDLPPQTTFPPIEALEAEAGGYVFRDEAILGTRMQLNLVARNHADAQAAAIAARVEIDRLDRILNSRDPDSELSILNRSSSHSASPELFAVVTLAEQWRTETSGAYSGRLGLVLNEWQRAVDRAPSRETLARLAQAANRAHVGFDSATRAISRPDEVEFALDAVAKGWIIDRAFDVAMNSPGVSGALVDIGGDIRCGGRAPDANGWCVGIPDARLAVDNAPLVATAQLSNHAIATSGRGPRDLVIDGTLYSPTLSPHDGWPIDRHISVSAIASSAADADALATALLVMPQDRALKFAAQKDVRARITTRNGVAWTRLAQANTSQARFVPEDSTAKIDGGAIPDWPKDWQALATFTAPRRQLLRDPNFRSPYMAMWITDPENHPVRTLIVVGKRADWQKDNFIWWSINREKAEKLVSTRSVSTSGAGVYNVFWDGVDDRGQTVPAGNYVLHVETSRERGKHTHRSLALSFNGAGRFVTVLPPTEEGGGLRVSFDHY